VRRSAIVFVLCLGSCAGAVVGVAAHRVWPESPLARGVRVGDRVLPRGMFPGTWLAQRRDAAEERIVRFRAGDRTFETTLGTAGATLDVAATLEHAETIAHEGPLRRRLDEAARARRGEIDVPLVWFVDEGRARALLSTYAPALARAPVDARLDLAKHAKVPDVPGRELDVEASIAALARGTHDDEEAIELSVRAVPASVSLDDLARVDVEKVASSYETTFVTYGTGAGRAVNIENAASRIDGTVLAPGAVFSFNDTVGPRTRDRGFALAPEIQGDEMTQGYGGGTCQVSSTLHAAALFGALDILERQSHSRPSSYTQMGLDATVVYPSPDLKIRNSLPFPVMIHAYLPKPTAIRVELLGGDPVAKVQYAYGVGNTEDFLRRIKVMPNLAPGQKIRHQKGSRGYDVTSIVKVAYPDGRVEERHYYSGYRPAPEVYWVAPGLKDDDLPPLPEHAKGVEGQPSAVAQAQGGTSAM
jgi:vancomycin resistance protein YoaR